MINFGTKKIFRSETRKNTRVNDSLTLSWQIKDDNLQGKAKIHNISETGMMIETKVNLPAYDNFLFTFEPSPRAANAIPLQGRRVWSKKVNYFFGTSLVGIEFVNPAQDVIANLRERINSRIARIKNIERLENVTGFVLIAAMVLVAAFALTQQSLIQKNYEETTKLLLVSTAQQADLFDDMVADLKTTKAVLAETETLLAEMKEENALLATQLSEANTNLSQANANLEASSKENEKLAQLVSALEDRLKPFEAEIASLEQGKSFMTTVQKRYKAIKFGIYQVRRKAVLAQAAAQKERDAILLTYGNRGFLVKDSQIVADKFSQMKNTEGALPPAPAAIAEKAPAQAQVTPAGEKKVKINVTILENEK